MLNVGIIGLAHLHPSVYMPHFVSCKDTRVVAVSDSDPALLTTFVHEHNVNRFSHWQTLLEETQLDLVYIFLPHCDCASAAAACAARGIHVVVEKPVASSARDAAVAVRACAEAGVLFSTPYVWRYHPVIQEMKRIIDGGLLGRIVGCEGRCAAGGLHRYIEGKSEWMLDRARSGGGPMYNLGVHWIDLFRWLLQAEITNVLGKNVQVDPTRNIEDNSFALATFSSGVVLSLDISYTVPDSYPYGRDLYLGLRGTDGCLAYAPSFEGLEQSLFVCSNHPDFAGAPQRTIRYQMDPVTGYAGSCGRDYVADIAHCVTTGQAPRIGGEDAIRALCVAEAVYESAETGRDVAVDYQECQQAAPVE